MPPMRGIFTSVITMDGQRREFFPELPRRRPPCRYDNPIPRPVRPGRFVRSLRLQQLVRVPVSYSCAIAPPALFREGRRLATPVPECRNINLRSLRRRKLMKPRPEEAIRIPPITCKNAQLL